jgi:hypothetical protein
MAFAALRGEALEVLFDRPREPVWREVGLSEDGWNG